jgi:hypothetical protein
MTLFSNHEFVEIFFYRLGVWFTSKKLHQFSLFYNAFKVNQEV